MFIKLEIDDINSYGSLPKLIQFSGKEYFIIGQLLFKDTAMNNVAYFNSPQKNVKMVIIINNYN